MAMEGASKSTQQRRHVLDVPSKRPWIPVTSPAAAAAAGPCGPPPRAVDAASYCFPRIPDSPASKRRKVSSEPNVQGASSSSTSVTDFMSTAQALSLQPENVVMSSAGSSVMPSPSKMEWWKQRGRSMISNMYIRDEENLNDVSGRPVVCFRCQRVITDSASMLHKYDQRPPPVMPVNSLLSYFTPLNRDNTTEQSGRLEMAVPASDGPPLWRRLPRAAELPPAVTSETLMTAVDGQRPPGGSCCCYCERPYCSGCLNATCQDCEGPICSFCQVTSTPAASHYGSWACWCPNCAPDRKGATITPNLFTVRRSDHTMSRVSTGNTLDCNTRSKDDMLID